MGGKSDKEIADAYAPLHEAYAPRCLQICLQQRGFYIKIGQVISGAGAGVMPQVYVDVLKVLQEDCPYKPFRDVRQIIEDEFGVPLTDIFSKFSEKPLGAASIGQVHTATLTSGAEVVVKVQYPESERNFSIDMHLFVQSAHLLAPEQVDALKQIQENFLNEFDYVREAALQRRAAEHLSTLPRIVVPLPVDANPRHCCNHWYHPPSTGEGKLWVCWMVACFPKGEKQARELASNTSCCFRMPVFGA